MALKDTVLLQWGRTLKVDVPALPDRLSAAFAAACAERVSPIYVAGCARTRRRPELLETLEAVWRCALGEVRVEESGLSPSLLTETRPVKGTIQPALEVEIAMLNAANAVLKVSDDGAYGAARAATNALVSMEKRRLGVTDFGLRYEQEVVGSEVVLREVERQKRDFGELVGVVADENAWARVVQAAMQRAMADRVGYVEPGGAGRN